MENVASNFAGKCSMVKVYSNIAEERFNMNNKSLEA